MAFKPTRDRASVPKAAGEWTAAVRAARRDLAINPTDVDARERLFWSLLRLGRVDDARLEGQRLSSDGAASLPILLEIAKILIHSELPNQAITLLRDRWREDPAAGAIFAWAYDAVGNHGLAEFVRAEVAGASIPESPGAGRTYFANQLAALLRSREGGGTSETQDLIEALEMGRFTEVGPLLFRWLGAGPEPALAILVRADWSMLLGDTRGAETMLRTYPFAAPFAADVENRLGDIARLNGRLEEAIRHWKRAVVLRPDDWDAWMDLMYAEAVAGDAGVMTALADRVLQLNPPQHVRTAIHTTQSIKSDGALHGPGVYGLGWTEEGGGVLRIQCELLYDERALLLTGYTGRVLEESARVAFEYLRRTEGCFDTGGAHLHFPDMRAMVDGASAGLALLALLWTKVRARVVTEPIAITGQIGLQGEVYGIGGLKEKLIAAHLSGIKICVIPGDNRGDLAWLPASLRRDLRVVSVSSFDDLKDIL